MTRLFIENREIELDESVQFAITKQFEDLSNPTTIINDWSKTVSIPFTARNNEIFGHIYNPDRLTVSGQNLLGSPSAIKKWNGSAYEDATLVDGNIVCDIETTYLQLCFQYSGWIASTYQNYMCNNDSHMLEFVYDYNTDYRVQFAFKNPQSSAPNDEVMFVYWDLFNMNLIPGETYIVSFTHKDSNGNYVVSDFTLSTLSKKQPYIGVNFDPLKKLDMRLQWGDDVLMVGYAKMNKVKQNNGKGTYELTLFGELGKVFQEMKKITFDTTTDDTEYLINGEDYVDEFINKELVYDCWNSTGQTQPTLYPKWFYPPGSSTPINHPAYKVTDIIGFAPNNSFSDGFDYKTYQNTSNTSKQFTETLGDAFTQATGVEPDTAITNGLFPREIGEYRSYLQLPYIYWNKLFQVFQAKAEEVTGYNFELDPLWFNNKNPYWYNLVFMLYGFGQMTKDEERKKNNYAVFSTGLSWGSTPTASVKTDTFEMRYDYAGESYPILIQEEGTSLSTKFRLSDKYQVLLNNQIAFRMQIPAYYQSSTRYNLHLNPNNAFEFTINALNPSGTVIKTKKYLLCDRDYEGSITDYFRVFRMTGDDREAKHLNGSYDYYDVYVDIVQDLEYKDFSEYATLNYTGRWINTNYPFKDSNDRDYKPTQTTYIQTFTPQPAYVLNVEVLLNPRRSNAYFTLNDLWNNDYNLFNEIIKYCKMFRIGISVDEYNKKIVFKQYSTYFNDYTVKDWTDKIDKSKDYVVKPITFENKYVLFNYKDSDTDLGKKYKEKYGVNYGEYRLITDYNFNNKTTELFNDITQSITNTDNILSWTNLYNYHTIIYSFPNEIYVYNKDKDKKQVSVFGSYFFHNGLSNFNIEEALRLRPVKISDDTDFQQANNTYFYTQNGGEMVSISTYPALDIMSGDNICVFNIPKENYTYLNNYIGKNDIYSNFWENYLNERYNIQNKIITCYVMLKPSEYNQFQWNQLVKVGNQLCIVNKIYDYNITSNQPTKVDLITIQNIKGYTTNDFLYNLDTFDLDWSTTLYIYGETGISGDLGHFNSITQVTFENDTTTYTVGGVKFTIVNNDTVHYETVSTYLDKEDLDLNITLKNKTDHTATFNIVRYATFPYPWIIVEDLNGNEVTQIQAGSGTYKLKWHGTETEGLENKPTVTITIISLMSGTGVTIDDNSWAEDTVMVQEGDDEWFRNEYSVNLTYALRAQQKVQIEVVDKEGWHETKIYNVI